MANPVPGDSQARQADLLPSAGWTIADHLDDMVSAHAPDGSYRYVSAASRHLLGYEPEELVGTTAYDLFHPDDAGKVGLAHESALSGAPFTVVYRMRRKSGDYVWVETTTSVVTDEDARAVTELICCTRTIDLRRGSPIANSAERAAEMGRIERVLAAERIAPVFQPICDLDTGRTAAIEALARFPGDPAHTPDRWFADAWDVGLGVPLELLAARLAAAAVAELDAGVELFINASPPVVAAPGFLAALGEGIEHVTIEVTEHLRIDDYSSLALELAAFREAGGKLAIDDFGAGYASFRHILELQPQWIKLDESLVQQLETSEYARGLATAVQSFATDAGVGVIAEGIETEAHLRGVREIGIRHGQGFHLARPEKLEVALASITR